MKRFYQELLVFLKEGQEVARIVGATTKAEIVDKLSKLL